MKRLIGVAVCLFVAALHFFSQGKAVEAANGSQFVAVPPFLTSGAPPLVMLAMGRDHKLYYEAYNDASDLDEDGALEVRYKPSIDYYGYFDSNKCYNYETSSNRFVPFSMATDKKCQGAAGDMWSGNFLNYITMARIDAIRKVLYGGYRSTDTAGETVLQRTVIPQDAHSWGKEYTSIAVDGYDIADYTPFAQPLKGTRHLFANTTAGGYDQPPLLRYALNNTNRIWTWVSRAAPQVLPSAVENANESRPNLSLPVNHTQFEALVLTYAVEGRHQGTIPWRNYGIRNKVSQQTPSPSATNFGAIDGAGNPFKPGTYGPTESHPTATAYQSGHAEQNDYMLIFTGTLQVATGGSYSFGVDGDDSVEVIINGGTPQERIVGYYGAHGRAGQAMCQKADGTGGACSAASNAQPVTLSAGTHRVEFRFMEATGSDQYYLYWRGPDSGNAWRIVPNEKFTDLTVAGYDLRLPKSLVVDRHVKVKVCDPAVGLEANCRQYPNGKYKPIGLLQRHGEKKQMYFGLMTGSYAKNASGGVLRKRMGSIDDEIEAATGIFKTPAGNSGSIIKTIDNLRIYGYTYAIENPPPGVSQPANANNYGRDNCGWITSDLYLNNIFRNGQGGSSAGRCSDWGNPIAEIMYESMRYFAGKKAATAAFDYGNGASIKDNILGLSKAAWNDPYDKNDGGFDHCSKPFLLVFSDINPSYDTDQLPGVAFSGSSAFAGDLAPEMHVGNLAKTISEAEGLSGKRFIGESGTASDGYCSAKNMTAWGLGAFRGLCPEEPTKRGGYYAASVAYYGKINDLNAAEGDQKVTTYAVALASPLPEIKVYLGPDKKLITLVPFGKTVGQTLGNNTSEAWPNYAPTNTIVDFYVEEISPTHGNFQINFEDVEQGADHDMDALVTYEYWLVDNNKNEVSRPEDATQLKVTLTSTQAAGNYIQHMGYVISGTRTDGPYLEVRDLDTPEALDIVSPYDTPPGYNTPPGTGSTIKLKTEATRYFTPGGNQGVASLLKDPLWYAGKWGGFEDKDGGNKNIADGPDEWDKDQDGTPDNYFFVVNPLKLEEQLSKAFADILNRASSGTAASVISSSRSGEGAIYQSLFYPELTDSAGKSITWAGQAHSLLVDANGNMREDTNGNARLDLIEDRILRFKEVKTDGNIRVVIDKLTDLNGNGVLDPAEETGDGVLQNVGYDSIAHLWNSSAWLNALTDEDILVQRSPYISNKGNRYIFTWVDKPDTSGLRNGVVDDGEVQNFVWTSPSASDLSNPGSFYAYLNLYPSFGDRPAAISAFASNATLFSEFLLKQTERQVQWMRGLDYVNNDGIPVPLSLNNAHVPGTELRSRSYDKKTWRLGDIVYSTPTTVAEPMEKYHLLYKDESYTPFYMKYLKRRAVIYVGANDGMLHAFNGGFYSAREKQFCRELNPSYNPFDADQTNNDPCVSNTTHPQLGAELWAYAPYNLLPHLYWLTEKNYGHVYYVDNKPRIFDAKIFPQEEACGTNGANFNASACVHPNGWGTIMVVGMRFGGAAIRADLDKTDGTSIKDSDPELRSAFIIFDITNPEQPPTLLGEIAMPKMGFATNYPAMVVMKDGDKNGTFGPYNQANPAGGENLWLLAFGSGPANLEGAPDKELLSTAESHQRGNFYLLDLVQLASHRKLMSLNSSGQLTAGLHPYLTLPGDDETKSFIGDPITVDFDLDYNADVVYFGTVSGSAPGAAADSGWKGKLRRIVVENRKDPATWTADNVLFNAKRPITAAPTSGIGQQKRDWVFFGTGRYFTTADGLDMSTQGYYGIKEPLVMPADNSRPDPNNRAFTEVAESALVDVTNYRILANRVVDMGGATAGSWSGLMARMQDHGGWRIDFLDSSDVIDVGKNKTVQRGERNLGQATFLGGVLSFTTFKPSANICTPGGESFFWARYFETGTDYYRPILSAQVLVPYNNSSVMMNVGRVSLGSGLASPPSLHVGSGTRAFIQTSKGDVVDFDLDTPFSTKSGKNYWRMWDGEDQ